MMKTLAAAVMHLVAIASFAWAMDYQMNRIELPEKYAGGRKKFGGVFKYLTFLNMLLQFIFFCVAFLANFYAKARRFRDILFASAAFPIGMFVGIVFWTLFFINRELIFPKILDDYFPAILNHCMHTTVIPFQLFQMMLIRHNFPSRSTGFTITAMLFLSYLAWVGIVYAVGGFWVYPVLKVLGPAQRTVFFVVCGVMGGSLYVVGEKLNTLYWGRNQKED